MGTTSPDAIPYPDAGAVPYVHLDIKALADKVQTLLTAAKNDRAAIRTEENNREAAQFCKGSAGAIGSATAVVNSGTPASALLTGQVTIAFTAPASGAVRVDLSMYLKHSAAGSEAAGQIELRTAAGAQVDIRTLASCYDTNYVLSSGFVVYTGLTPGASYNIRPWVRSGGAGTATGASATYSVTSLAGTVSGVAV